MEIHWEKPRDYDKRKMLYPDRCMLKFQGMILSDHSEMIKEEEKKQAVASDPHFRYDSNNTNSDENP